MSFLFANRMRYYDLCLSIFLILDQKLKYKFSGFLNFFVNIFIYNGSWNDNKNKILNKALRKNFKNKS